MGRSLRVTVGGLAYHVLNQANRRARLFDGPTEYAAFLRVLAEGQALHRMRLLAYTLMPNHWHLVLRPTTDRELSDYVGWVTLTHTQRWHAYHHTVWSGHLYKGRFKSPPTRADRSPHPMARCPDTSPRVSRPGGA